MNIKQAIPRRGIARLLAVVLTLLLAIGLAPAPSSAFGTEDRLLSLGDEDKQGDDRTTNWDFIVPVTHLTEAPEDYTPITTPEELATITHGGNYILMNDIDLSSYNGGNWTPIGTEYTPFYGTLDGNGYIISNMNVDIDSINNAYGGLFGYVGNSDNSLTISNIGIENSSVTVSTNSSYAGGLVGCSYNSLTIENSYNTGRVTSTSTYSYAGGLVGSSSSGSSLAIENSYNTGRVTSTSTYSYAGGLVGRGYNSTLSIENSYNTGGVTSSRYSSSYAGGLVGYCYYDSTLTIENSYNTGCVTSSDCAGGLVGSSSNNSSFITIENSYNTGNVTSAILSGGLVGYCYGYSSSITIYNSHNMGGVTSTSTDTSSAGGLIGRSDSSSSTIENSYNTGEVTSTTTSYSYAGGLVGWSTNLSPSTIKNSYNTGDVFSSTDSSSYAGGLVGSPSNNSTLSIENSYNTGEVTTTTTTTTIYSPAGGLVGSSSHFPIAIENSYYKNNIAKAVGDSDDSYGMSLTAAQMIQQASYVGFDFDTVWQMPVLGGTPVLQSIPVEYNPVTADKLEISVDVPVTGVNSAVASVDTSESYSYLSTVWETTVGHDALAIGEPFAPSTEYTATVVLTGKPGLLFVDAISLSSITGTGGTVVSAITSERDAPNDTLTVVINYDATADLFEDGCVSPREKTYDKYSDGENHSDISITLTTPSGNSLSRITSDVGDLTIGSEYTVIGDVYTFKSSWLDTLSLGSHVVTFDMTYGEAPTVAVTIVDTTPEGEDDFTYIVKFDSQGGSAVAAKLIEPNKAVGELATPARTGYTFKGWYTAKKGGTRIAKTTVVKNNITYYAQWTAKSIKVKHDANKGKNLSVKTKTVTFDSKYGALATTTRTGYAFKGWYTARTGGTKVTKSTTVKNEKDHTLYAQWAAKSYKIKYNVNGGKALKTKSKTVKYGSKYGELAKPVRAGYTFKGWYTKASGGTKIKDTSVVKITKTTTLYAHWEEK